MKGIFLLIIAVLPHLLTAQQTTLENKKVRGVFAEKDGHVTQQFFAKRNSQWVLIAESFAPPANFPDSANQLLNTSRNDYRYLTNLSNSKIKSSSASHVTIEGLMKGTAITETINLDKDRENFHIEVKAHLPETSNKIEYLLSTYQFIHEGAPDFIHTPTLKYNEERWNTPERDQILGDRSFHSPAIILQQQSMFFAMVPDLNAINRYRVLSPDARRTIDIPRNEFSVPLIELKYTMPTALDMNIRTGLTKNPVLTFGLIDNIIQHHIRYLHPNNDSLIRTVETGELRYAFDLFVSAEKPTGKGFQDITPFIWNNYGHPTFENHQHLAMPFEKYVTTISGITFKPMTVQPPVAGYANTGSFLEFDLNGEKVGGFRSAVPEWTDALWNSVFWNNARDAVGMYIWAKRLDDTLLLERAKRTINLLVSAPQNDHGLFPLIYRANEKKWQSNSFDVFNDKFGLFSAGTDCETYDVTAMSKTAAHMIDYYKRCEKDKRIVEFTSKYADWLAGVIDANGMMPSYVRTNMQQSDILRYSAQPSSSMWFLSEIYSVTQNKKYLEAAKRIASFLQKEVLPLQKWIDLEQYFSCGIKSLTFKGDQEQGQLARGNLSVAWAADGFSSLFASTNDKQYLESGERCIDYLTFTQCSWNPHYIYTAYAFGGFSVDNSDHATYLDARQAEYVKPLIWYGKQLGRADLIERGVAAARASVVLINHPLHKMNGIYEYTNIYTFGLGPENIDHEGHPQSAMRTHAGWGEGSGIFAGLSDAVDALEGIYVNPSKNIAVGVDGLSVTSMKVEQGNVYLKIAFKLSDLEVPYVDTYKVLLKMDGVLPRGNVYINGKLIGKAASKITLQVKANDLTLSK